MQLQGTLVPSSRFERLGHDKPINITGITLDNNLGEGRDDRRTELTTIRCLRNDNVFGRVENGKRVTIVLALTSVVEVVHVVGTSRCDDNDLFAVFVTVLGAGREILEVINHRFVNGSARCEPTIEIESTVGVELLNVRHVPVDHTAFVGTTIVESPTNGETFVHVVGSNDSILDGNYRVFVGVGRKGTLVLLLRDGRLQGQMTRGEFSFQCGSRGPLLASVCNVPSCQLGEATELGLACRIPCCRSSCLFCSKHAGFAGQGSNQPGQIVEEAIGTDQQKGRPMTPTKHAPTYSHLYLCHDQAPKNPVERFWNIMGIGQFVPVSRQTMSHDEGSKVYIAPMLAI